MSEQDGGAPGELLDYAARHARPDDEFLVRLKQAALREDIPQIAISSLEASLLQILLRLQGAREVVEVGTLAGYSAIRMARALPPGGRVRTIEFEARHAAFAREWVSRSDVADRVEVYEGAGAEVLPRFGDDSADAAFIDADKENYALYLRECLRIVRPGGMICADNAFGFGRILDESDDEPSVAALRAFNEAMAATPGLQGAIVPVGDGLWVAVLGG